MSSRLIPRRDHHTGRGHRLIRFPAMSIRLRLTLWYTAVLAASILAFGLALYILLARGLATEIDQATASRAHELAPKIQVRTAPPTGQLAVTLPPTNTLAPETYVQVADAYTGHVVARSVNVTDRQFPVRPDTLTAARQGRATIETLNESPFSLRVYNTPLRSGGQVVGVIQVAQSRTTDNRLLRDLRLLLLTLIAIALPVAAWLGWVLAGRALAPIEEIANSAAAIGRARAFAQRVAHRGPPDELGRLANTINDMLAELEVAHGELTSAKARLEQTVVGQRRFLADASHELRTPLTTIRMNAELLAAPEAADAPEDWAKALADITDEAERMSRLVNDLLTLARADAGQRLTLRSTPLRPLLDGVCRQAQLLATGQQVELDAPAEVVVLGDTDALKQLLLILLDNALKYTPSGGRITIALRRVADEAHVVVADTGVGIPAIDLPRIFERFYQTDTAREAGGSGLGLAIARWIAGQHAGRIEVDSHPGRGSTFTVVLPACGEDCAATPEILTPR